jgi:CO/xanthine dehydrogenase FAD-binding subunit
VASPGVDRGGRFGQLNADAIATIAERALYDAQPLAQNRYKITLAETLIRRGITALLS